MTKLRKTLIALVVIGVGGALAGVGTFASFSASTTNADNTFATGTLVLSNKVGSGDVCFSSDAGSTDTNDGACDVLFDGSALHAPGEAGDPVTLVLENEGSLDGILTAATTSECSSAEADDADFSGSGDLCDHLILTVMDGSTELYSNPIDDFSLTDLDLGADDSLTLTLTLTVDGDAGNDVQGLAADFGVTWTLEQAA